jgi:vacuolar-type H+-ATPase subunit F/Vma7
MANPIVFVGDEIAAAGFRLAGAGTRVPAAGSETAAVREEAARAALVLVARRVAERIEPDALQHILAFSDALVLVLPDAAGLPAAADVAARVRLQLNVGEA